LQKVHGFFFKERWDGMIRPLGGLHYEQKARECGDIFFITIHGVLKRNIRVEIFRN